MNLLSHKSLFILLATPFLFVLGCKPGKVSETTDVDAAKKVYVAPGKHDELYLFTSGGFSGQIAAYGLPSGRLLKVIPVFAQDPENGWGYNEETKPMLNTSHGFIPWDDAHHTELSKTNGEDDGRWIFINGNNTPRIARIDLVTFKTAEIIELPNSAGNHASPFCTENTEYLVGNTRFSIPEEGKDDVPIESFKENFQGNVSFVSVDKNSGTMKLAFQIRVPGFDYDLAHAGKGPSHDWMFFTTYNTEQAHTLLEVNASQKDKDFVMALNWKKAEQLIAEGKGKKTTARYAHNVLNEKSQTASSTIENSVLVLDVKDHPELIYYMPCPKSPHGIDVTPDGEFMVASGKLAATLPVFSFKKMLIAIKNKSYEGKVANNIPVLKYESVLQGEVQKPGLGPLHTEFDDKGFAYTTMFVSSEIVKWRIKDLQIIDRIPVYYSPGHLCVPGGDSKKPYGKYVIALNKITKDRYLPTGPELTQSAQLIDITGNKMKLLLDFPTIGEPHYAQAIPAEKIVKNQIRFYKIEENENKYVTKSENDARVVRTGNRVDVYMTAIRSHLAPDNIEGVKVGDEVYFHLTNLEQDWDVPHGFAVKGANTAELLVMPGETNTLKWVPDRSGMFPFYCTDFCSALHQEMQGYLRVSPKSSNTPLKYGIGEKMITKK
ncbi:MAG: Sec-dependent nitrous-oxide reductase [Bacteroidetes bacterium]|nr:Sec-dependent nitrous-oxide reductase [Bacteroidota bacterium]MBU1372702.1 Sec-dependent nitrous-oxide reductase [Bacteroidota bacterium]MBU1484898.1 Sec-dependent nitrous-oxide reductase [Bacteroidota bacterium]MBU1761695.1 Sec-dependent nitrous-oxide reductase [Bacteroidota bacterium]MBU2045351.1 Sec-dependent nitrous-oxide reductase [Bacteroidota bacterium]